MSELEMIANAGFQEIKLAGETRKIGKLTMGDFADFEQFVTSARKKELLATAKELYGTDVPEGVFDKAIAPPSTEEIDEYQERIAGVRFLLWCALKKFDSEITQEQAGQLVSLDDLETVIPMIMPEPTKKKAVVPKAG